MSGGSKEFVASQLWERLGIRNPVYAISLYRYGYLTNTNIYAIAFGANDFTTPSNFWVKILLATRVLRQSSSFVARRPYIQLFI